MRNGARRRSRTWLPVVWGVTLLLASWQISAQVFKIDWFTVDGGGGTSRGGEFEVSGTVGQADAGIMQSAGFTLSGGFWGIVRVVQTPGAPPLSISRNANSGEVTVFWPLPNAGWVLDESPTLGQGATPWLEVSPASYQSNAIHRYITIPNPTGTRYYRLRRP